MNKRTKTILIVIAIAGAAYLAYRWYQNRQSGSSGVPQLGTNLNSVAPELIGGSTGPQSGLNYYAGATNVYLTDTVSKSTTAPPTTIGHTGIPHTHPLIPATGGTI